MKAKLPTGLFYRSGSSIIWCWYYVPGRRQPIRESTRTTELDAAKRFRNGRLAEHPTARAQRLPRRAVTTADALVLYERECARTGVQCHRGRVAALKHALGAVPLAELTRARLDELCDEQHGLKLRNRIVWHFEHCLHASRRFSGRYETLLWFTRGDCYTFNLDAVRVRTRNSSVAVPAIPSATVAACAVTPTAASAAQLNAIPVHIDASAAIFARCGIPPVSA
jgi:DNA methylase